MSTLIVLIACGICMAIGSATTAWLAWKIWENQEAKWAAEVEALDTEIGILRQKVNELEGPKTAAKVSRRVEP